MRGVDLMQRPFEVGLDEGPGAHIARLFLAPDHVGLRKAGELLHEGRDRERIELFDPHQIDIVDAEPLDAERVLIAGGVGGVGGGKRIVIQGAELLDQVR